MKPQHTAPEEINRLINRGLDNDAMSDQGPSTYSVRGLSKTELTSLEKGSSSESKDE